MSRIKLFIRSLSYSLRLILKSSNKCAFLPLFFLINSFLPILGSFLLKLIIDSISLIDFNPYRTATYITIYIFTLVFMQIINVSMSYFTADIYKRAAQQYKNELMEDLNVLPVSVLDSSVGKDQIDDVSTTDYIAVRYAIDFFSVFSVMCSFFTSYFILAKYNILFSTIHVIITVPSIFINAYFNNKMAWLRYRMAPDARRFSYYRWMLTDVAPAKDVRMYDLTTSLKDRYQEEKINYIKKNKKIDKRKCLALIIAELFRRIGEIVFVIFVVVDALNGIISIGEVTLYISLAITATEAFKNVVDLGVEYYLVRSNYMKRLFEFKQKIELYRSNSNEKFRKLHVFESLTFDHVCFKYPYTESDVLKDVSFTLNKGDKLSLVGINGSGKSTIIKLMLGLYEIESGQILINGYPMSDYDIRDVRKMFSVLFQSFVQYPLTLRDNIALSDYSRASDSKSIETALKQSGVYGELQDKLLNGLDSFMTRQFDDTGTELSKGQWQKIALSRAYFKNAEILIFDEPSAALDAEAEDRIFKNFEDISEGKTGIMISHRISAARISNKILVLDGGVITESGTHDELVALGGLYAKLYTLQKEKYTAKEGMG